MARNLLTHQEKRCTDGQALEDVYEEGEGELTRAPMGSPAELKGGTPAEQGKGGKYYHLPLLTRETAAVAKWAGRQSKTLNEYFLGKQK